MKHTRSFRHPQRGSLLIVAMILCAVIGVSLASYIQLGRTSMDVANRALYSNGAVNLAENGLEEAMYSLNKKVADPSYSWPGWTVSGADIYRTLPASGAYTFEQNATGAVRVFVSDYLGNSPKVVARSKVTLSGSSRPIEKWVEIQLNKTSKYANGLVARERVRFSGLNTSVDSWNSDPDNNPATPPKPYDAADVTVRHDKGSISSPFIGVDDVLSKNVSIWGSVATGGTPPAVGSTGLVGPFGTPAGTVSTNHVSGDFAANFAPVTAPTSSSYLIGSVTTDLNLPRPGDIAAADGKFYYTITDININSQVLNIQKRSAGEAAPKVVIIVTNAIESINITDTAALNIESDARLEIYAAGDIKIAGKGVMNGGITVASANQPICFQIWGTKASGTQAIQIAGNGVLSGVVYAPQGSIKIKGTGDFLGSAVANDIFVVEGIAFHYDESLQNLRGSNPFRVSHWKELTSASSRTPYASALSF